MSVWLIALCGLIYLYVAAEQYLRGSGWMGLMYFGYAVANVGAVAIAIKGVKD